MNGLKDALSRKDAKSALATIRTALAPVTDPRRFYASPLVRFVQSQGYMIQLGPKDKESGVYPIRDKLTRVYRPTTPNDYDSGVRALWLGPQNFKLDKLGAVAWHRQAFARRFEPATVMPLNKYQAHNRKTDTRRLRDERRRLNKHLRQSDSTPPPACRSFHRPPMCDCFLEPHRQQRGKFRPVVKDELRYDHANRRWYQPTGYPRVITRWYDGPWHSSGSMYPRDKAPPEPIGSGNPEYNYRPAPDAPYDWTRTAPWSPWPYGSYPDG